MLIVEGSDLVGKTELCNKLIQALIKSNFPVIPQHFGLLEDSWDYYWDYLPYINRRTIMDRFIMSEVVYGNVVRDGSRIDSETYRILDGHLRQQGSVTVVVVATDDWLHQQILDKYNGRDEKFSQEQILEVNRGFSDLVHNRGNDWMHDFHSDCDFVYQVNNCQSQPSGNRTFIKSVVELYLKRQKTIDEQLKRNKSWSGI